MVLTSLSYVGGKSFRSASGVGRWVADQLPYRERYCEPFAGMLGVFLNRKRSKIEIVNDTDGLVVNWWRVVRDQPEELGEYLEWTAQFSREEWQHARTVLYEKPDASPLEKAAAYTISSINAMGGRVDPKETSFISYAGKKSKKARVTLDKVRALAERMREVEVENIDAVRLLEKTAKHDSFVIYCDPPYPSSAVTNERTYETGLDYDAFHDVLLAQKGFVAVSGYGDDFDALLGEGWGKLTKDVKTSLNSLEGHEFDRDRTEAIWVNRPSEKDSLF